MNARNVDYHEFYKDCKHFILPDDESILNGFLVGALDACLTTRCTLHCRGCAHLTSIHDKREDWDAADVISALDRIFDNVDYIARINLIGGEPLLIGNCRK